MELFYQDGRNLRGGDWNVSPYFNRRLLFQSQNVLREAVELGRKRTEGEKSGLRRIYGMAAEEFFFNSFSEKSRAQAVGLPLSLSLSF